MQIFRPVKHVAYYSVIHLSQGSTAAMPPILSDFGAPRGAGGGRSGIPVFRILDHLQTVEHALSSRKINFTDRDA